METTLCMLFLESARRYSALADAVFSDSVSQSQFASRVSGQRMEIAKAIHGKKLDMVVTLENSEVRVMEETDTGWKECINLDNLIMSIMSEDEYKFSPLLQGVYEDALYCAECIADRYKKPTAYQCLSCGAISAQAGGCPVCGSGGNWCAPCEPTPPMQGEDGNPSWWIEIKEN